MPTALSPRAIAESLTEFWSPRIIGEVDDSYVKVAKIKGSFDWHQHDDEDEMFFILKGKLSLEFEDGQVELSTGEMYIVPKGVRHRPVTEEECQLMLFEKKSTSHTGDVVTEKTKSIEDQLPPACS